MSESPPHKPEGGLLSRLISVLFGLGMVVVLEIWYLGRQLTASTSSRVAKRKYTTLPEGVVIPPRRLSRTLSAVNSGADSSSSATADGLRRTISSRSSSSSSYSSSSSSLPLGTTASSVSLATGLSEGSGPIAARTVAMAQGYSSTSTSSGFGSESLLVTKLAVVIVVGGALVYFPFWLNLVALAVLGLARHMGKQAQNAEDDVIALREIPSSRSKGMISLSSLGSLSSFFAPLGPEDSLSPEERRAKLIAKMKPALKVASEQFTTELALLAKVNPAKFKNGDVPADCHWMFINSENGVLVFKNSSSPRQHLSFLCKVVVPQSAANVYEFLKQPANLKEIDPLMESITPLETLDPNTLLLRVVHRGGEKCLKEHARDFCTLYNTTDEVQGKYRVLLRSILVSKPLPTPDLMRGEILTSGFYIEETSPTSCNVTLLSQMDPKQSFPHSVYSVASANQHILLQNLRAKYSIS